ncbi:KAP family NTPase [Providencia rettgeri]|uniref:KAP family P-loop NTPase fold protein n=1 Tax=Providencia TaxID=586 RepID=UPI001C24AAB5|nr:MULTISPECIES: P-loop NTPase fold protein [Providencia]QXB91625.1 KAP family NTPase [Providencia rettgeri]
MSILPVQPNFNDGFTSENDIFGRKKLYEQIKNIVSMSSDESIVLGLDDDWGNGKTSFVKMVEGEIAKYESDNINVIYFDAFKNDYQSDPLLAMISSIYSMIETKTNNTKFKDKFLDVSKAVAFSMFKHTPKALIGFLSAKIISNEMYDGIRDSATEALSEPLEKYIEDKIGGASKEITEIENFKRTLESIYEVTNKRTLFIIDELDRAKPDFSLGIIEKVKHLFDARGFCFLLVMNRKQFEETIKVTYGNINTSVYLNKFIHMWFKLPILKPSKIIIQNSEFIASESFNIFKRYIECYIGNEYISDVLSYLLVKNDFSLREAERCISLLKLCYNRESNDRKYMFEAYAISLLVFLRIKDYSLVVDFLHKNKSQDKIRELINISGNNDNIRSSILSLISYHYFDSLYLANTFDPSPNSIYFNKEFDSIQKEIKSFILQRNELAGCKRDNWKLYLFEYYFERMENIEIE